MVVAFPCGGGFCNTRRLYMFELSCEFDCHVNLLVTPSHGYIQNKINNKRCSASRRLCRLIVHSCGAVSGSAYIMGEDSRAVLRGYGETCGVVSICRHSLILFHVVHRLAFDLMAWGGSPEIFSLPIVPHVHQHRRSRTRKLVHQTIARTLPPNR
jgi:hypothetical protein